MASELWQRIRAARKYADLRQQDVAQVCGVSRAAIAQWEYDDPQRRTTPSIDQMKALSKLSGVPLDWLLNDRANLDDIWQYAKTSAAPPLAAPTHGPAFVKDVVDELVKMQFFRVLPGFYKNIGMGPLGMAADFVFEDCIVEFKDKFSLEAVAQVLMIEKAVGPSRKILMVRNKVTEDVIEQISQTFGVTILSVTSAREAANYIRSYLV